MPALGAGGHYDPKASGKHGLPWGDGHLGDLPALYVDPDGNATYPVLAPRLKVDRRAWPQPDGAHRRRQPRRSSGAARRRRHSLRVRCDSLGRDERAAVGPAQFAHRHAVEFADRRARSRLRRTGRAPSGRRRRAAARRRRSVRRGPRRAGSSPRPGRDRRARGRPAGCRTGVAGRAAGSVRPAGTSAGPARGPWRSRRAAARHRTAWPVPLAEIGEIDATRGSAARCAVRIGLPTAQKSRCG